MIAEILYAQLQKAQQQEKEKRDPCKIYPSSVSKCIRAIVFQMLGYKAMDWSGASLMIVENGTYTHHRLEDIMEASGIQVAAEASFRFPERRLSGRTDSIIKNPEPFEPSDVIIQLYKPGEKDGDAPILTYEGPANGVILLEYKSIKESGFEHVAKSGPKEAHILQVQLYMHFLKIPHAIIVYENKNTQELLEFRIEYDPSKGAEIEGKINMINWYVDHKELPEKPYDESSFDCRYCDYRQNCWPSRVGESIAKLLEG